MKSGFLVCGIVAVAAATAVSLSGQEAGKTSAGPKLSTLSGPKALIPSGIVLTEKELAEMKSAWTDEKTGMQIQVSVGFSQARVEPRDQRKFAKSGEVPFRVTAVFSEGKKSGDKLLWRTMDGTARLYIMDSEKRTVFGKTVSLGKMCPS